MMLNLIEFLKKNRERMSLRDRIFFLEQASFLLSHHVPIKECLLILKFSIPRFSQKIILIEKHLESGYNLHEIFEELRIINTSDQRIILISGEKSGNLDKSLKILSDSLKRKMEVVKVILSASFYPVFLLVFASIATVFMFTFVMPKIIPIFQGMNTQLPLITKIALKLSYLITHKWHMIAIGLIAISLIIYYLFNNHYIKGKYYNMIISKKFPIHRVIWSYYLIFVYNTVHSLMCSGESLDNALLIASDSVKNTRVSSLIKSSVGSIRSGFTVSWCMKEFMKLDIDSLILTIAERTGEYESNILYLKEYHYKKFSEFMNQLLSYVGPVFMLIVGVQVALSALAILLPIYSITGSMANV